jgi:hypothetical protein
VSRAADLFDFDVDPRSTVFSGRFSDNSRYRFAGRDWFFRRIPMSAVSPVPFTFHFSLFTISPTRHHPYPSLASQLAIGYRLSIILEAL